MKKKKEINLVCKECNHINQPKETVGMWNIINTTCDECGGGLRPTFD